MRLIKITALDNGAHENQEIDGVLQNIPEGWAVIPDDMECENFPFGEIETEEINGIMTVTQWMPGSLPDPSEVEEQPTLLDQIEAQVTYTAMMTNTLLGV